MYIITISGHSFIVSDLGRNSFSVFFFPIKLDAGFCLRQMYFSIYASLYFINLLRRQLDFCLIKKGIGNQFISKTGKNKEMITRLFYIFYLISTTKSPNSM